MIREGASPASVSCGAQRRGLRFWGASLRMRTVARLPRIRECMGRRRAPRLLLHLGCICMMGCLGEAGPRLSLDAGNFTDDAGTTNDGGVDAGCKARTCFEPPPTLSPRAYIGPAGVDPGIDCDGGTRAHPWRTWTGPRSKGCIQPGDTIYLLAGRYREDGGVFADGRTAGNIFLDGTEGHTITLAADPEAPSPVTLQGSFIFSGAWAEIRGLQFESGGTDLGPQTGTVTLRMGHATLRHNDIHSLPEHFETFASDGGAAYNCLKLPPQEYSGSWFPGFREAEHWATHHRQQAQLSWDLHCLQWHPGCHLSRQRNIRLCAGDIGQVRSGECAD